MNRWPNVPAEVRALYLGFSKADFAELCCDLLEGAMGEDFTGDAAAKELVERRGFLRRARNASDSKRTGFDAGEGK